MARAGLAIAVGELLFLIALVVLELWVQMA